MRCELRDLLALRRAAYFGLGLRHNDMGLFLCYIMVPLIILAVLILLLTEVGLPAPLARAWAKSSKRQVLFLLIVLGVVVFPLGIDMISIALTPPCHGDCLQPCYLGHILIYIEGTYGAMVMVAAGIGALLAATFESTRPRSAYSFSLWARSYCVRS